MGFYNLHKLLFLFFIYLFIYFFYSWEEVYQKELETFKDIGDVGEIW